MLRLDHLPAVAGICAVLVGVVAGSKAAHADPVAAVLAAQYFEVANNTDPDFSGGSPVVADGSQLGPNGFPIATGGISDINSTTGEITWWSPSLNSNVSATGTGTVTLPYASNMYAPNSTGSNDSTEFETAFFTGAFTLTSTESVEFSLGSDDDSFIYVDGTLIGQNPGIHGVTDVDFTASDLAAGTHSIEIFYADRESSGAYLSLSLLTSGVVITPPSNSVPEPISLILLGTGLAGIGIVRRRRRIS